MEDVLNLYGEAPDPKRPVVCFDESPIQLIGEVRPRRDRSTLRLRVAAQRHREPVRVPGREPPLAQGEGHRAACRRGLRRLHARPRRRPLSRRGSDSRGARQPVNAFGPARSTRHSRPMKRDAFCAAWSSITSPSTQAGSTWSRSRSASWPANVSIDASTATPGLSPKLPPGRNDEMPNARPHQLDVHNRKSPRQNASRLSKARRQIGPT